MAMILDPFASMLGEKLANLIEEEVAMLCGVKGELVKLQRKLIPIQRVLEDAEKKAFHDPAILHWTARLKDVMYDADDVIDEFRTKQLLQLVVSPPPSSSCNYTSFLLLCTACTGRLALRHQIGRRIKNINLELDDISKEKEQFQLLPSTDRPPSRSAFSPIMSSPTMESDVVGSTIEEDTKNLVAMLIKEEEEVYRRSGVVLVFAIVGIGGIGKTTLAQFIYNHPDIKSSFHVKVWVCVSKEFSVVNLLKEILTSARCDPAGLQTRASLEPMVENALSGNKFLIVLDDVWSSERVWEDFLRNPLKRGASGSRILVTTRDQGVAMGMKAVHTHSMQFLSPEDGWSLICKKVASDGEDGELEGLKDIGLEIVKKCDGLPLAIKTIGGVLCKKEKNRRAWEGVLHNTTWSLIGLPEDVNRALYLSYDDLPPRLKQCFLYCALFPEDTKFIMYRLVRYWISEGFVRAEGDLTLEDVGEGYYWELVQRSFLQRDTHYIDNSVYKMHDLLWSLAQFLTKGESLFVHKGLTRSSTANLLAKPPRRISVVGVGHEEIRPTFDILKNDKSLRTLLTFDSHIGDVNIDDVTKHFTRLRVLDLSGNLIERLPHSIGNFVHLRYLDLSGSNIRELPKSIEKLVNLEFMILRRCRNLRNLGGDIVKLQNLRCLDLYGTPLEGMPTGVGKLKDLNTVEGFVVNNNINEWGSLEEVKSLSMLRQLIIYHLERAWTEVESYRRGGGGGGFDILKSKMHLTYLLLGCSYSGDSGDAVEEEMKKKRIEEVFELLLCPPRGLEELWIIGYYGINFPSWMTSAPSFLPNLRHLFLTNCIYCGILPPLGNLPNLELLKIEGARSVIAIGAEFIGHKASAAAAAVADDSSSISSSSSSTCSVLFPKLIFTKMPNWEKWEWEEEQQQEEKTKKKNVASMSVLPRLIEMWLVRCPKLRSLPVGLAQNATSLTKMRISDCPNLESISCLPSLQQLELIDYEMERLPEWLLGGQQQFPALQKLQIGSSISILRRCLEEGSPDWSKIQHFPRVYGYNYNYNKAKYFSYTRRSGGNKPSFNTNILDDDE